VEQRRLVDLQTAADILGLSPYTVRDWLYHGQIKRAGYLPRPGRYGRPKVLFYRDDIEEIATRRQQLREAVK